MNCEMRNLNELAKFASVVAKDAGKIQLEYFRSDGLDIQAKLNESDVVTSADKASESIYIRSYKNESFFHRIVFCRRSRVLNLLTTIGDGL